MRVVSRYSVSVKVKAAHHNCHPRARIFIAWDQFNARSFLNCSLELDAPARPLVLLVRRKFPDMAINLPNGFSSQLSTVERAMVRKVKRADGSCLISEGHEFP
jgi:hypothetical protein